MKNRATKAYRFIQKNKTHAKRMVITSTVVYAVLKHAECEVLKGELAKAVLVNEIYTQLRQVEN